MGYSIRQISARNFQLPFLWLISIHQSVSTSSTACVCVHVSVCVLHHCDVMMNRWLTKRRRGGERKSDLSCAFLSLYFIMEITSFTLSTSPFISYCHWQNLFSICTSAVCLCNVCVCMSACLCLCMRESEEQGGGQARYTELYLHMSSCINEL